MLSYNIQGQNIFKTLTPPTQWYDEKEFREDLKNFMTKYRINLLSAKFTGDHDEVPK